MTEDTYREHLNDLQLEVEELRAKLKESQTGDTISRQAALDALDGVSWMHLEGKHEICDGDWIKADEAEEALKQLPSVQPEIKNPCSECQEFDCYGCEFKKDFHGGSNEY